MTEANTFNCPKCGASLSATGADAEISCPYCGNSVIVPEELRAPSLQSPQVVVEFGSLGTPVTMATTAAVGMSFVLPIIIGCVVLAIVAGTFFFINQSRSQALAPLNNSGAFANGTGLAALATAVPRSTLAEPTETPAPTPVPAATPTPFGKVLLKDDFTNSASGWDRKNSTDYVLDYVKNGYRIYLGTTSGGEFTWIKDGFSNVSVETDAKRIAGPTDGWFGVTCRMKEGVGGYAFEAGIDGSYLIDKYAFTSGGDQENTLTHGTLDPGTIKASDANHIRGSCDGSTLSLFINDKFIGQTTDDEFKSGGVGLAALTGSGGVKGFDMLFSNFVVKGP